MTPADLDALAALVGQLVGGSKWETDADDNGRIYAIYAIGEHNEAGYPVCEMSASDAPKLVALVNAAPDLLRLARKVMETR